MGSPLGTKETRGFPPFPNPCLLYPDRCRQTREINIKKLIEKYLEDFSRGRLKKPEKCELCRQTQCLNWHGFYRRQVITLTGTEYIPIRRVLCKECGRTFAVLPGFILKRRRYGLDVIRFALEEAERTTCEKAAGKLTHTYGLIIDVLTIWLWKKKIPKLFLQAAPQM